MFGHPVAREPHYSKGPQEISPVHFPPTAPPLHACDPEHSRETLCLTCLPRFPTHLRYREIVVAFLNCLLALGHLETAVSLVSLQVAVGIRIQGLTEMVLGVWLDQVDGMVYAVSHEIVHMLNN